MTTRKRVAFGVAVTLSLAAVSPAAAQIFTPTYMAPRPSADVGLYLSDGPGDFAVEGIWRGGGPYNLGLRLGVADFADVGLLLGGELRNPIALGAPIDVAVTGALQGLFADDFAEGGLAIGLSLGHTFAVPEIAFTPYLHPRLGILTFGDPDDDIDLELLADFGFDVSFGRNLELRLGISFEDVAADWGIGLAWR